MPVVIGMSDDFRQTRAAPVASTEMRLIWFMLTALFWLTAGYDVWMLATKASRDVFGGSAPRQSLRDADANRDYSPLFAADAAIHSAQKIGPNKFEVIGRTEIRKTQGAKRDTIVALNFEPPVVLNLVAPAAVPKSGGIVEATRLANRQPLVFEVKARSL